MLKRPSLKVRIRYRWNNLTQKKRESIVFIMNYGASALPLTLLTYIILTKRYTNFFFLFLAVWIILIFFEYYYKWLRKGWQE